MTTYAERLATLEPATSTEAAMTLFDDLPAIRSDDIRGTWVGRELATGHPSDGLLSASGWYGKQFDGPDSVHPLLFRNADGQVWISEPRRIPLKLAGRVPARSVESLRRRVGGLAEPAFKTKKYRARIRDLEHRGVMTAAMIYDGLPIIDIFRRVDDDTVLGLMDQRDVDQPYFFVLTRKAGTR
ncbi:DUF4334 domain-containing protein [Nocardia sp. NPDC005825]|uniref:DUF4334 domain-containing protein n=1 Tax=unclassified Nocardia TaxID=2637762 RepID=UPI0033D0520C